MNDPGGIRVSDAEREDVVERLRVASVEGRLTLGELTERTEAAYSARTQAELAVVTSDLPGGHPVPVTAYPPPAEGGRARRWFVAVMGSSKRRGSWRIDKPLGAVAVMGDVVLDLRQAEVRTGGAVDIVATAVMGDVKIIVPDGVDVELDGVAIMGDKKVQVIEAPPGTNAPLVRVRAYVVMGDVKVVGDAKAKPLQKAWAAWREQWNELRQLTGESGLHQLGLGLHQVHPTQQEHSRHPHSWNPAQPPQPPQPPYPPPPPHH